VDVKEAIARVVSNKDLSESEIAEVVGAIMDGAATPAQIGGFLIGLRMKGETPEEIAGAARAMRKRARQIDCSDPEHAVDTCGTGGDGHGTANISTMAAIVAAAAGAIVAKHGNRAQSSRSGSADVLEALGVRLEPSDETLERCFREVRIAFLFAPSFHAAMKHAAGPRRELGTRTLFNLLGPLTNPAGAKNQVLGVFDKKWCEPVARALGALGARKAFVVHGDGGLDEIAVRGKTRVAAWDRARGSVEVTEIGPEDFGLDEADPAGLAGGDANDNARLTREVLAGKTGPMRTAVLMEAAMALVATDLARDYRQGRELAERAIASGAASKTLDRWVTLSKGASASQK
jgi:anthranilate phosphoribosyltransferase